MTDSILSMIGLSKKAGRAEIGEEPVGSAARAKKARVILVASDAAASSVRRAYSFSQTGACLCLTIPATKDELGSALGRTSCAMMAITDIGFADAIVKKLAALQPEQYKAASEKLELKAQRMAQRKREKLQHEKNLRQGKHRAAEAPAKPAEENPPAKPRRTKQIRSKSTPTERFANSRPVKKGKGSGRKKK
ncbi:MAG: 50S ribosomal protein L7 [Clostridiales bacterium]|nr:50S ribosomal protein L7 [Candidatus Cacconaster stercorequi]